MSRARQDLAHTLRLRLFFSLITNAQIERKSSNDNRAGSDYEAFKGHIFDLGDEEVEDFALSRTEVISAS